jgi:hypothetical protein
MVIYLDVNPTTSRKLRDGANRIGDIHEDNDDHIQAAWFSAQSACNYFKWEKIECDPAGVLRSPDDIHAEVLERINSKFSLF